MRHCFKCGADKDSGEFYTRRNYRRTTTTLYSSYCKDCDKGMAGKWNKSNKKRRSDYMRKWRRRLITPNNNKEE